MHLGEKIAKIMDIFVCFEYVVIQKNGIDRKV